MFTLDFAEDFSGLSEAQIARLERLGILQPKKQRGAKYYTYGDIYILRVHRILLEQGLKPSKISDALEYLRGLKPDQPLSSFVLLFNNKDVFTIIDGNEIAASKWGQMLLKGTVEMIALGSELESLRRKMNSYVNGVKQDAESARKAKGKIYKIDQLDKLFA